MSCIVELQSFMPYRYWRDWCRSNSLKAHQGWINLYICGIFEHCYWFVSSYFSLVFLKILSCCFTKTNIRILVSPYYRNGSNFWNLPILKVLFLFTLYIIPFFSLHDFNGFTCVWRSVALKWCTFTCPIEASEFTRLISGMSTRRFRFLTKSTKARGTGAFLFIVCFMYYYQYLNQLANSMQYHRSISRQYLDLYNRFNITLSKCASDC